MSNNLTTEDSVIPEPDKIPDLAGQLGLLLILSAPSGAGKTSLYRALLERMDRVVASVSHTTRPPRPGESNGVDYHFVTPETFDRLVEAGEFLEHAQVFDRQYGTSSKAVEQQRTKGNDVVLEIDWQGARQVREKVPGAVSVFVLPPSREILWQRLVKRDQDSRDIVERRMRAAESELSHYDEYDYVIINDRFEEAVACLEGVVRAERCRLARRKEAMARFTERLMGN